jgi:hypothetical protein
VTRSVGPSRRVTTRRVLAVALGLATVAGTAAVAQASAHGDGFLTQPSAPAVTAAPALRANAQQSAPAPINRMPTTPDGSSPRRITGWPTIKIIGDRTDPAFNQILDVGNSGTVVGYRGSGADGAHPNQGYLIKPPYRQRDVTARNAPHAVQTQVIGINQHGDTVGFWTDREGVTRGFVRRNGQYHSVAAHGAGVTQLLGLNDRGIAAGFFEDSAGQPHGFLYDIRRDRFVPVSLPVHADGVTATGVNDRGVVSGFYSIGKITRGFVMSHGRLTTLRYGGDSNTQALGLDSAGDVVGSYADAAGHTHGFVLSRGRARRVDVPHRDGDTVVNGLNDRGQAVGFITEPGGRTEGFVARIRP